MKPLSPPAAVPPCGGCCSWNVRWLRFASTVSGVDVFLCYACGFRWWEPRGKEPRDGPADDADVVVRRQ